MSIPIELILETVISAGKIIYKKLEKKKKQKQRKPREENTIEVLNAVDEYVGGKLGDKLIKALEEYKKTGQTKTFEELKNMKTDEIDFAISIARDISLDIQLRTGKEIDYIVGVPRELKPSEIKAITIFAYKILYIANAIHNGPTINLYLAAPTTMALQLGQLIGIGKYKIRLYQYTNGEYKEVPPLKRENIKIT